MLDPEAESVEELVAYLSDMLGASQKDWQIGTSKVMKDWNGWGDPVEASENLNASRPSEHTPVRGESMSKRLGGIIGWKDKTSSWRSALPR